MIDCLMIDYFNIGMNTDLLASLASVWKNLFTPLYAPSALSLVAVELPVLGVRDTTSLRPLGFTGQRWWEWGGGGWRTS
jgi:hypothetical protein